MNKISWNCFIWSGIITILSVIGIILLLFSLCFLYFLMDTFLIARIIMGMFVCLIVIFGIYSMWADLYLKCKYRRK